MKRIVLMLTLLLCGYFVMAQESNNGKKLWAKSVLNEKAPELVVTEWLTEKPNTKGKFVLVDFWATWCGPCRKAIPELNELQKTFKDKLVVIGISDETAEKVKAMSEPIIEYYSGIDKAGTMKKALDVRGIPHVILIDPQGIVRWEGYPMLDGHELKAETVKALIEKYGKGKK
ncbi:MAG: TlpA family protein disulfide reductase [Marinifilaceae bacterium]